MMDRAPKATLKRGAFEDTVLTRREVQHDLSHTHSAFNVGIDAFVCKKQLYDGDVAIKSSPIKCIEALNGRGIEGRGINRFTIVLWKFSCSHNYLSRKRPHAATREACAQ